MKIKPAENTEEEDIEQVVDEKFQGRIEEEKIDWEIITTTEIKKPIKGIKNKKAEDKNTWKTEWIKEERSEMVQSLETLSNRVEKENKIPIQSREKN